MTSSRLLVFGSGVLSGSIASIVFSRSNLFKQPDSPQEQRGKEILKYGTPSRGPVERYYANHVLQYDQARKVPVWVAEHLTVENVRGKASRKHAKFRPDPSVDNDFSATNEDYWDSGWSRGHMAPAGDNKRSQEAMEDTFYLSNILPQDIRNNGGFWNRFEIYCRHLTKKFDNVRVISGPVMMPTKSDDGRKHVTYPVIGESEVAVPTHLYKVIVTEDKHGEERAMAAFVVPNIPISFDHSLKEYQVELSTLEKQIGLRLLPKLDKSTTQDLCQVSECELMNREEFELYILARRLWAANSKQKLEKVWQKLEDKNLTPTKWIMEIRARKLSEFEKQENAESEV